MGREHRSGHSMPAASQLHNLKLLYLCCVQVWDVLREAAISNYRGHTGYVLCADWSPVDPDVIWTGGKDFTVQEWRVSKQEFTVPPKGEAKPLFCLRPPPLRCKRHTVTFMLTLAGKKITKLKEKMKQNKKNKKASGTESPAPLEMNGEPATEGQKAATAEQEPSGEDEEEEVSSTSSSAPPGNRAETTAGADFRGV